MECFLVPTAVVSIAPSPPRSGVRHGWRSGCASRLSAPLSRVGGIGPADAGISRGIGGLDGCRRSVESRRVGIAVLGPLTIEGEWKNLARRDRVVLAALAVHPGEVVSAGLLADVLWEERPPASAAKVVQGCVVRLRKLARHPRDRDIARRLPADNSARPDRQPALRACGRRGPASCSTADEAERAAVVLADVLTLWRGRPFDEVAEWDTARIEVARLTELRQVAHRSCTSRRRCGPVATTGCSSKAEASDRGGAAARAAMGAARDSAVPGRSAGRGAGDAPAAASGARPRTRARPEPGDRRAGAGDPASGSGAGGHRARCRNRARSVRTKA